MWLIFYGTRNVFFMYVTTNAFWGSEKLLNTGFPVAKYFFIISSGSLMMALFSFVCLYVNINYCIAFCATCLFFLFSCCMCCPGWACMSVCFCGIDVAVRGVLFILVSFMDCCGLSFVCYCCLGRSFCCFCLWYGCFGMF